VRVRAIVPSRRDHAVMNSAMPSPGDRAVVTSMCRLCMGYCGIRVTVEDGRVVHVTGDPENPLTRGFTCAKGRTLPEQLSTEKRLLHSMARTPSGGHERIPVAELVDAVARRIGDLLERHGPRSVATYAGTGTGAYMASMAMADAFAKAIGSPMAFYPGSIDQPGKQIAMSLHGRWSAGTYDFGTADVWMFIGTNPIVSMWAGTGIADPIRSIRDARRRGMRVIVVDPRRTELAALADVHLRPRPGEDAALLAGLVRAVLASGRYDADFVAEHADGREALEAAVAPFEAREVEARTGVPVELQEAAVATLLSSRRGCITAGTGANMTPWGSLTESLGLSLHSLCGYWRRAGELVTNPGVLMPPVEFREQAEPAPPLFGATEMRARPLCQTSSGMPTAALADEMLLDGPDRVRALLNLGGNPVTAWPDQLKTVEAIQALDLLVCFDIRMSATSRYADYVVASKFALEVPQVTSLELAISWYGATCSMFPVPYGMYSPAVVTPPPGSEVVEEWEVLLAVAGKLGVTVDFAGERLEPGCAPTTDDFYEIMYRGTRVPLSDVRKYEHGHVFDEAPPVLVLPRAEGHELRLQLGHDVVVDLLRTLARQRPLDAQAYPFRLTSRRMKNSKNSSGIDVEGLFAPGCVNPAFMHPDDLDELGLTSGDTVRIRSERSSLPAIVEADNTLVRGMVSMAHAWGDAPERDDEFRVIGSCTNRLIDSTKEFDAITGMPYMTAVPVTVEPLDDLR
jgi:anaerobic selenocysteine-containing dehydrogenase